MSRYSDIDSKVIDAIANAGFSVYMPATSPKTYLFFTDGKNIGYLQRGDWGGYSISTVNIPCRECGTGFRITDDMDPPLQFTREALSLAFVTAPNWARSYDLNAVRKWGSMEVFLKSRGSRNDLELVREGRGNR